MVAPVAAASFFPSTLGGWSSALGGIGQVLGGLGIGSKKKRGPSFEDQLAMQHAGIMNDFRSRVQAAKENGIHPLYALGASPSTFTPTFIGDNSPPPDFGAIGQGLDRAFSASQMEGDRKMQDAAAALDLENRKLQNEMLKTQVAASRQALIRTSSAPPLGGGQAVIAGQDPRYPVQESMPMGYGDTAPLLRVGRDPKGNPIRVYNDDLGDNELLQAITAMGFSIPDWIHGNITRPAARGIVEFIRSGRAAGREYRHFNK